MRLNFNTQAEIDEYFAHKLAEADRGIRLLDATMLPLIAILVGIFLGSILFLAVTS